MSCTIGVHRPMSFLKIRHSAPTAAAAVAAPVVQQSPMSSVWNYAGGDAQWRNFSAEHVAALEAAFNTPEGPTSQTKLNINGARCVLHPCTGVTNPIHSWLVDFQGMTMRQLTTRGYTTLVRFCMGCSYFQPLTPHLRIRYRTPLGASTLRDPSSIYLSTAAKVNGKFNQSVSDSCPEW